MLGWILPKLFTAEDLGGVHNLLADDVATAAPTLSSPTLTQVHVLLADDVVTAAPTLSSPTLQETDILTADDIAAGVPTASSPVLGHGYTLLAGDVAAGVPTASSPALGQEHVLLADDIASGVPALSKADMGVPTAAITAQAYISHACAIRDVADIKATQDTMDEWGPGDSHTIPWDDPIWDNSYVHYFAACVHARATIDGDVVTKTGRASIVATATATGTATETIANSGTVLILRWN